jgi:hypothetical protein
VYNYTTTQAHSLASASDAAVYAPTRDSTTARQCPVGYPGQAVPLPLHAHFQLIESQLLKRPLWGVIAAPVTPPAPDAAGFVELSKSTEGFLDRVNEEIVQQPQPAPLVVSAGDSIRIDGWAVDMTAGGSAAGVFVVIDDDRCILAGYGWNRPDIADYLGEAYRRSGFAAEIPTEALSPGPHTLELWVLTQDRHAYYTSTPQMQAQIQIT